MKKLFFVLLALMVLLAGCGGEPAKPLKVEPLKPIETKKEQPKKAEETKNFGMDVSTFRNKFNELMKNDQTNQFQITGFYKIDQGSKRTVHRHKFNEKCEIMIVEGNDSKKVESVSITALPNTPKDAMIMTLEHTGVVGVFNPEIPNGKRPDILRQLKVLGAENLKGLDEKVTIGNTVYSAMELQGLLVLMAMPK